MYTFRTIIHMPTFSRLKKPDTVYYVWDEIVSTLEQIQYNGIHIRATISANIDI